MPKRVEFTLVHCFYSSRKTLSLTFVLITIRHDVVNALTTRRNGSNRAAVVALPALSFPPLFLMGAERRETSGAANERAGCWSLRTRARDSSRPFGMTGRGNVMLGG